MHGVIDMKIKEYSKPAKLYPIVYKIHGQLYKQLDITLQVLKIFKFVYR